MAFQGFWDAAGHRVLLDIQRPVRPFYLTNALVPWQQTPPATLPGNYFDPMLIERPNHTAGGDKHLDPPVHAINSINLILPPTFAPPLSDRERTVVCQCVQSMANLHRHWTVDAATLGGHTSTSGMMLSHTTFVEGFVALLAYSAGLGRFNVPISGSNVSLSECQLEAGRQWHIGLALVNYIIAHFPLWHLDGVGPKLNLSKKKILALNIVHWFDTQLKKLKKGSFSIQGVIEALEHTGQTQATTHFRGLYLQHAIAMYKISDRMHVDVCKKTRWITTHEQQAWNETNRLFNSRKGDPALVTHILVRLQRVPRPGTTAFPPPPPPPPGGGGGHGGGE